jgi:hypothetical protein
VISRFTWKAILENEILPLIREAAKHEGRSE